MCTIFWGGITHKYYRKEELHDGHARGNAGQGHSVVRLVIIGFLCRATP